MTGGSPVRMEISMALRELLPKPSPAYGSRLKNNHRHEGTNIRAGLSQHRFPCLVVPTATPPSHCCLFKSTIKPYHHCTSNLRQPSTWRCDGVIVFHREPAVATHCGRNRLLTDLATCPAKSDCVPVCLRWRLFWR